MGTVIKDLLVQGKALNSSMKSSVGSGDRNPCAILPNAMIANKLKPISVSELSGKMPFLFSDKELFLRNRPHLRNIEVSMLVHSKKVKII